MAATLVLVRERLEILQAHLFPEDFPGERAAFLFMKTTRRNDCIEFHVAEHHLVDESGARFSSVGYLELTDETRASVIKRAHDLDMSLGEVHSHRLPFEAGFSPTDVEGLREFVKHVWWRLKGKPYVALVAAPDSFDGLVWTDNPKHAVSLDALVVDGCSIELTGRSLRGWEEWEKDGRTIRSEHPFLR